ncbi:hypothetical protein ACVMBY_009481 [Bradyrhizobium huanghuaihaiense]
MLSRGLYRKYSYFPSRFFSIFPISSLGIEGAFRASSLIARAANETELGLAALEKVSGLPVADLLQVRDDDLALCFAVCFGGHGF